MKLFLLLILSILSISAHASFAYVDNSDYQCSNGKTYDVLRRFQGGWGPGSWNIIGLCDQNILKNNSYDGRFVHVKSSHVEVKNCVQQDTEAVRKCYKEFVVNNGHKGGELPEIKHANGYIGPTCGDKISRAQEYIDSYRKELTEGSVFRSLSQSSLNGLIRDYGVLVRDCNEGLKTAQQPVGSAVKQ